MSKGKLVAIFCMWMVLVGIGAVAWKFVVQPFQSDRQAAAKNDRIAIGSSDSRYDHRVTLAADAFSGYAVLRSPEFHELLGKKSIKVQLNDDGADYGARLAALQSGQTDMAVFTIDALLKTCSAAQDLPGSIVAIIDETRGADAIVGFKKKFESVDDFNDPNIRFVLTPDSPSETLARVVMTAYDLPLVSQDNIVRAESAKDVYDRYRNAKPDDSQVFVLWEPYVSKMLENHNVHTIVSSRDLRGYIVDVLVVRKEFLKTPANEQVVRDVVESYFSALYQHRNTMEELMLADAKLNGEPLTVLQAKSLVDGVQWKQTQQNYSHFGISDGRLQHIEDMIENITKVLVTTKAIGSDPTQGRPNLLFYDNILRQLMDDQFHPAGLSLSSDGTDDGMSELRALTDREWQSLKPVGKLKVPQLEFPRGRSLLMDSSRRTLDDLASTLSTHNHYLMIRGNANRAGDLELNKQLAAARAQAAADYLVKQGVSANRIRASGAIGNESAVNFVFGQLPY